MIKISVIVPVYNVQKYIKKCIDSILAQTLPEIEILCIDDGSTDDSGKILDEYSKRYSQIKVIHKENAGYGKTMNLGLSLAQGEYIGIVESDDFIETAMYEELYAAAKERELDFIKSSYWEYSEEGRKWIDRLQEVECETVFSNYENMNKIFAPKSIWSGLYKRDFLIKNKIRFLETPGASYQDTSFWIKVCIAAERGYFTKKAYVNYRVDNVFSSVNSKEKVYYVCDELRECERYLWESELDVKRIYPYFVFYKRAVYAWNLERILPEFREKYMKRIGAELRRDITHSFMNTAGFYEEWQRDIVLLSEFYESYCRYLNEDFSRLTIRDRKDIDTLIKKEEVYLYGAGKIGQKLGRYMKEQKADCEVQYVVSNKANIVSGGIFSIADETLDTGRCIVIAVASGHMEREMAVQALNRGFDNIAFLNNDVRKFLANYIEEHELL